MASKPESLIKDVGLLLEDLPKQIKESLQQKTPHQIDSPPPENNSPAPLRAGSSLPAPHDREAEEKRISSAFETRLGNLHHGQCLRLAGVLRDALCPEMLCVNGKRYFQFQPENGPEWSWVIPAEPAENGEETARLVEEVFPEAEACMLEFYRVFDDLRTPPNPNICRDGFIPLGKIKSYGNSAVLREVFPEFLSGRLVYENAAGCCICLLPGKGYFWLAYDTSYFLSPRFEDLLSKFVDGFVRNGRGLDPYSQAGEEN